MSAFTKFGKSVDSLKCSKNALILDVPILVTIFLSKVVFCKTSVDCKERFFLQHCQSFFVNFSPTRLICFTKYCRGGLCRHNEAAKTGNCFRLYFYNSAHFFTFFTSKTNNLVLLRHSVRAFRVMC